MKTLRFKAEGMTCTSCEKIITKQVKKIDGVKSISIDYASQIGSVTYDPKKTSQEEIFDKIEEKGYSCSCDLETKESKKSYLFIAAGAFIILIGLYIVFSRFNIGLPQLGQNIGYGLLFAIGLLTGFHCIGMCGGFIVSYTAKNAKEGKSNNWQHFQYGSGKLISYTVIGGIFGLIGSVFVFSNTLRSAIAIIAGLFLIIFGLNMLNIFPFLRKLQLRIPNFIPTKGNKGPLVIGLLNGLFLACGPLQAMYIYAMGTQSFTQGALSLMFFGLGTTIPLLGFGVFAQALSSGFTRKILKLSGIIVIILGLIMLNRGLALSGSGYDINSIKTKLFDKTGQTANQGSVSEIIMEGNYQIIYMNVTADGWQPDKFILKTGVPVKWRINGIEITSCNNAIQVPAYNLRFDIKPGIQEIIFTPTKEGVVAWSCWMGMIPGTFIVKDDVSDTTANQQAIESTPLKTSGGSCGGASGGGCGCGIR